jgi:hypothetical protein
LLANAASGPFLTYVLPQRLEKEVFVGTTAIFFAATDIIKVPPLVLTQQFSSSGLMRSALLLPLAIVTNFLGIWLVRRTSTHLFYRVAYWLVFGVALTLIWQGMTGVTLAAAAAVGPIAANASLTQADATLSAAAAVAIAANLSVTEADQTLAAAAAVTVGALV